jgi:PAS domain S-box-containing protein
MYGMPINQSKNQKAFLQNASDPQSDTSSHPALTGGATPEVETQRMLAAIVASSDDAIISKTLDGIITSWNNAATTLYGYTAQEAIGQHISLIIPDDLRTQEDEIIAKLRKGIFIDHFETRRVSKDGRMLDVSLSISPIKDQQGRIIGAAKIARDVTERKRTEAQEHFLAEVSRVLSSTLDYQETLGNIAKLVVPQLADWFSVDLVDDKGEFELVLVEHRDQELVKSVRAYREKWPLDPDASVGAPHIVRTGQSELYSEITDEMLVAGIQNEEKLALVRQIGIRSVMNVPLVACGKVIGVVTFVSSNTGKDYDKRDLALAEEVGRRAGVALDQARLHREVRRARDQLAIILQGVADGIVVYDHNGHIIYANEAAAQMTDTASVEVLLTQSTDSLVSRYEMIDEQRQPFPRSQYPHRRVLAGEREAEAVIGYTPKATREQERWSFIKSRPVYDEQGKVLYIISIMQEITERVQAEQRKDEFIGMTSHELKTPITSLKGFTYVLQRRLSKQGDEQTLQYLSRMDAQLDKLTKLISDLLDISRMQTGQLELEQELFDLDALVTETVENMQAATSTHRLFLVGESHARILGDKDRVGQVLINVLTNAIKYSPQTDRVLVERTVDGQHAIIRVQDFGIGINEVHQQKIFERFYQVTNPEEKTYPGLGIGLYICKQIIERHHGHIGVYSCKGKGSTFSIMLPRLLEGRE